MHATGDTFGSKPFPLCPISIAIYIMKDKGCVSYDPLERINVKVN
jgi:hypothetical protein